jgi:hypothetical protein
VITVQKDNRLLDLSYSLFLQCKGGLSRCGVFSGGYRLKDSEWLPIVSSEFTLKLNMAFKKRRGVETFFAALKSHGFNLEDSGRKTENVFLVCLRSWQ